MSLRMVIGRAGSGKTRRFQRRIVELLQRSPVGPPIYLIVPRQASFTAQRDIVCRSDLPGCCRLEVLSFDELAQRILDRVGGGGVAIDAFGRRMILGRILRKRVNTLQYFKTAAEHPNLPAKLESLFSEFQRAGKNAADLMELSKNGLDPDDPLKDKWADLAMIFQDYEAFLGQDRIDPAVRISRVLDKMPRYPLLNGAKIFIDGYFEFSELEARMAARLAMICDEVEVALTMDPSGVPGVRAEIDDMDPFHRTRRACARLKRVCAAEGAKVDPPVLLKEQLRFKSPVLNEVERMFDGVAPAPMLQYSIQFVEAGDKRQEVEHAAFHIRKLLTQGRRLRDIVLLVRSLDEYHDLIRAAFTEQGIPFFADRRRSMSHHPLFRCVRAILALGDTPWAADPMFELLKSGLLGISRVEADELENYVLRHDLRGKIWASTEPWHWTRQPDDNEDPSVPLDETLRMDSLRRKIASPLETYFLTAQKHGATAREYVGALYEAIESLGIRESLQKWMENARQVKQHEIAEEHRQAWDKLAGLFDQLMEILEDEPLEYREFAMMSAAGLDEFDLAIAPPTVDQVLVGQVDRTTTGAVSSALVLGLSEGIFPRSNSDLSILSGPERRELRRRGCEVDPDSDRLSLDEGFLAYLAFTRASEDLYVSRPIADEAGRKMEPGEFWSQLLRMVPNAEIVGISRSGADTVPSARSMVGGILQWIRDGAPADRTQFSNLYQSIATGGAAGRIEKTIELAWASLAYRNQPILTEETSQRVYGTPLVATSRRMEMFAACPYRHFAEFGLQLRVRDEAHPWDININRSLRRMLETLVREMIGANRQWADLDAQSVEDAIARARDAIERDLAGKMLLGSARQDYLLDQIAKALRLAVEAQKRAQDRGVFQTALSAIAYGGKGVLPALRIVTPNNHILMLEGRIDRIDILDSENAFALFDYRADAGEIDLWKIKEGLALGALVNLIVAAEASPRLAGRQLAPAAALSLRMIQDIQRVEHPNDAPQPGSDEFYLRDQRRGIFDQKYASRIDGKLQPGETSNVINVRKNKDGDYGSKSTTDALDEMQLRSILKLTRETLAKLADEIMEGRIEPMPYRINRSTPCGRCPYLSVCRFDPMINRPNILSPVKRAEFLEQLTPEGGGDGD